MATLNHGGSRGHACSTSVFTLGNIVAPDQHERTHGMEKRKMSSEFRSEEDLVTKWGSKWGTL